MRRRTLSATATVATVLSRTTAIATVHAAYDLERAESQWLHALLQAFTRATEGAPGAGHTFALSAGGVTLTSSQSSDERVTTTRAEHVDRPLFELLASGKGLVLAGDARLRTEDVRLLGGPDAPARDRELLLLIARGECGTGWLLGATVPRSLRPSQSQRARWQRVASHITAAGRLRAALRELAPPAWSEPPQSLKAQLRRAALHRLRANDQPEREDEVQVGAGWSALASGSWSLVDCFETDGRCVVVALPNAAGMADPRALSAREREVVECRARGLSGKEIAYELGLRTSTVSQMLHAAVRKLRLNGVTQLGHLVRGLGLPSQRRSPQSKGCAASATRSFAVDKNHNN